MDEREMLALTAHMEGESVVVKNIGQKVKVSQMELICLCRFAKLGLLEVFSHLEGESGYLAAEAIDQLTEAIRKRFANERNRDGMARLSQSCVAILSEDRLGQYAVPWDDSCGA